MFLCGLSLLTLSPCVRAHNFQGCLKSEFAVFLACVWRASTTTPHVCRGSYSLEAGGIPVEQIWQRMDLGLRRHTQPSDVVRQTQYSRLLTMIEAEAWTYLIVLDLLG